LKKRQEDDLEFLETEAKCLAAKLIALDRDLARELHRLLCLGGELDLTDAFHDGLRDATADNARDDGLDIPECLRRRAP
jgi:hypothetical protein